MTEHKPQPRFMGRLVGEFIVVVFGILVALGVDDWRTVVADRQLESHLLTGIRANLGTDLGDLRAAISGARARASAADYLLSSVRDPDAGNVGRAMGDVFQAELEKAIEESAAHSLQSALAALGAQFSFDVSDASFAEAVASGRFGVIRDASLRSTIARYYAFARSFGQTPDARVEAAAERFRAVLGDAGLAVTGGYDDQALERVLRTDRRLIAELKNMREMALRQIAFHGVVREEALDIRTMLEEAAGT